MSFGQIHETGFKIAFGFRTSSSKTNQCAQARQIFRIRLRIQGKQRGRCFATPNPLLVFPTKVRSLCIYITKSEPILKTNDTSVPRTLKRHHAKRGASAKAEVRENALSTTQCFQKEWWREMQMRNASEILRNAGGVGESISQNSLRVLSDFLAGFGGAGIKTENT